jgi:hypothetical protein
LSFWCRVCVRLKYESQWNGLRQKSTRKARKIGFPVRLINVSESSRNSKRFLNLKADWFWSLRERFQTGQVKGLS